MTHHKESLSVVIPIYNEADCINELIKRLLNVQKSLPQLDMQFVFINDGSKDTSFEILKEHSKKHSFIKLINLSRNFGHQVALSAGLFHVDTDYTVMIDADLQDPPELIVDLYNKTKEGFDVIYAKRKKRKGETFFKKITASIFYRFINLLCDVNIPKDTGDFRLITQKVLRSLNQMPERNRFIRGMIPWMGFKSTPLFYNRDERFAGETKYSLTKMIHFAFDAIFSFSNYPLKLAGIIGSATIFLGIIFGFILLYLRVFTPYTVPGISAVILTVILLGGVQIMMIGIIGEYLGRVFDESKSRPLYFIDEYVNLRTPATQAPITSLTNSK